jgi:hypothetical protein
MPLGRVGEWRYSSTHFLTSALDGGEWSASHIGRFTPRVRAPGTDRRLGWPQQLVTAILLETFLEVLISFTVFHLCSSSSLTHL